jgi:hypothetical protein
MKVAYTSLNAKLLNAPNSLREQVEKILALDFSEQKAKFVLDPDFQGWTEANVSFAELLYKHYLYLKAKFPDEPHLPPSRDIDDFWHGHILDTVRYTDDCIDIFGCILHHNPYFGMGSESSKALLVDSFGRTQELHIEEFGAPIFEVRDA